MPVLVPSEMEVHNSCDLSEIGSSLHVLVISENGSSLCENRCSLYENVISQCVCMRMGVVFMQMGVVCM